MRVTVSFFNGKNKYINKGIKIIFVIIGIILMFVCLLSFLAYIIKSEIAAQNLVGLASNFSKRKETEFRIEKLMGYYPVFNSNNYILAKEETKSKELEDEVKVTEEKKSFDTSVVDAVSILAMPKEANLSITKTKTYDRVNIYGISMLNYSSNKDIDYNKLFERNFSLTKKSDKVLIYSTHTSETYTNSNLYRIDYTGNYRVRDEKYNMLSVADVLGKSLKDKNFNVTFDTTPHDYTSYENAYKNSRKTIQKNLEKEDYGLVIDVHRDASGDLTYGPTVDINGKKVARLMLVMGVGTKGYENKYWYENLSMAVEIMRIGESMYPGLFKPMIIRSSKYNQDLNENSILVEVGATGNTLEEAYLAARCLANIINKIYK